jgi:S-adenosylmethionine:tRNA ribosyltransferase-isomerase
MLVLYRAEQRWEDRVFREFPQFLQRGRLPGAERFEGVSVAIVRETRRLFGRGGSAAGAALSEDAKDLDALVHPGRKMRTRERVAFDGDVEAEVIGRGEYGERTLRFHYDGDLYELLRRIGHVPLPPYIKRTDTAEDRERYQTVFRARNRIGGRADGGIAFHRRDSGCLPKGRGGDRVRHAARGTRDVSTVRERSCMRSDFMFPKRRGEDSSGAARDLRRNHQRPRGGEFVLGQKRRDGFVYPAGISFQRTNAMLTNFHLPESSLLMLVCAFAGREFVLAAYEHAVQAGYRFYSYGDCMLIV